MGWELGLVLNLLRWKDLMRGNGGWGTPVIDRLI